MLTVRISPAVWEAAKYRAARILGTGIERIENYTHLNERNRYQNGFVGELVFRNVLAEQRKRFSYREFFDGKSHEEDFKVYRRWDGRPLKLDIKTNGKPYAAHLLIPAQQFDRHRHDLYVGVRLLDRQTAGVVGWITRVELAKLPRRLLRCETVSCPYCDLRDLEDLFNNLQNDQT